MDIIKESAKKINNITRKLTDGTTLSENQRQELKDTRSQLRKEFWQLQSVTCCTS